MKKLKSFLKEETSAAQMIEATIMFPVAFLIIFMVIYIGLYILQSITVGAYAQKIAILASREVSQPGYFKLVEQSEYTSSAIELNSETAPNVNVTGAANHFSSHFTIPYRYLGKNPLTNDGKSFYESALKSIVKNNSIIAPQENGKLDVTVECNNYFISQYITVTVKQELMHFGVLEFFGIQSPTVSASATATVSDTDELIRTTDFVVDAMSVLASKLGIDTSKLKETVNDALETIGVI